ncbi:MAG: MarR family transcriptional regulator, partial [Planctomycetota bacterium]
LIGSPFRVIKPLLANFILKMNHGLSSPTKIAAFLGVDPSSLSRMMRKLESSGLMTRKGDPINRSRVNVALTSKGKKKAASMEPSIRRVEEEVFSELNDKELRELRKLLQKVCVSLMEKNE